MRKLASSTPPRIRYSVRNGYTAGGLDAAVFDPDVLLDSSLSDNDALGQQLLEELGLVVNKASADEMSKIFGNSNVVDEGDGYFVRTRKDGKIFLSKVASARTDIAYTAIAEEYGTDDGSGGVRLTQPPLSGEAGVRYTAGGTYYEKAKRGVFDEEETVMAARFPVASGTGGLLDAQKDIADDDNAHTNYRED